MVSDEAGFGNACDGADSDLCDEGTNDCDGVADDVDADALLHTVALLTTQAANDKQASDRVDPEVVSQTAQVVRPNILDRHVSPS